MTPQNFATQLAITPCFVSLSSLGPFSSPHFIPVANLPKNNTLSKPNRPQWTYRRSPIYLRRPTTQILMSGKPQNSTFARCARATRVSSSRFLTGVLHIGLSPGGHARRPHADNWQRRRRHVSSARCGYVGGHVDIANAAPPDKPAPSISKIDSGARIFSTLPSRHFLISSPSCPRIAKPSNRASSRSLLQALRGPSRSSSRMR